MSDEQPTLGPAFDGAEISLTIDPDGKVRFEVSGVPGEGCEELERILLRALGSPVEHREHSPEYYARTKGGLADKVKAFLGRK